jgi:ADP-ribosylglycohydrolase
MEYIPREQKLWGLTQEPWGLALGELNQAASTGHDVAALRARLEAAGPDDEEALMRLYAEVLALPRSEPWPYFEASNPDEIAAALPAAAPAASLSAERIADGVRGAWFGRVIGNMMGKPFEIGPTRDSIRRYLTGLGEYPLRGYVPFADGADRAALGFWGFEGVTRGRIRGGVRDDDVDYTVLALHIVETYGRDYAMADVAAEWLSRFPAYQVFTAERNAYQNLIREVPLEQVGEHHNPFREWIGALIRADLFGLIQPGDPRRAALLTLNDARLSHRANGVYGAMWAAALIAGAFDAASPRDAVVRSLDHIPAQSRLAREIRAVVFDHARGLNWEAALDGVAARNDGMSWVHTINNAGALAAALLWGEGDFTATVALAVQAGLDTDSIGATAGAWAGAFVGRAALPAELVDPLEDRYESGVFGMGRLGIDALATRTLALVVSA